MVPDLLWVNLTDPAYAAFISKAAVGKGDLNTGYKNLPDLVEGTNDLSHLGFVISAETPPESTCDNMPLT
jgi:hypothetical protein